MKKRKRKIEKNSTVSIIPLLTLLAVLTVLVNSYFETAIVNTAVFSAGLAMPQGSAQVIKNSYKETDKTTETGTEAIDETPTISENKNNTDSVSSTGYITPKDIILMQQEYSSIYGTAVHDGVITEKQYDAANATSTYENITVRNTTPSHSINIEASLNKPATIDISDKTQPTVLIFHTHTTESYEMIDEGWFSAAYSTRSNEPTRNMVRVGTAICEELEKSGIGYIHDTEIHDTQYTGAYDRSRETITKILEENPSIQIVLDVHRDAIHQSDSTRIKPTVSINNKKAAQIMIIAGCEDGKVTSFPSWEQNLTFALQLHQTAETLYPGLMRPILFSARKYNMDVVPCSVLLEVGSDSNTLAEAEYSGHLIGKAIAEFVNNNTEV